MWRCKKCETWNEDERNACVICHLENAENKKTIIKEDPVKPPITESSFYDDWDRPSPTPVKPPKPTNILKVLMIIIIVLLVILGLLFVMIILSNLEASASSIQGGVEYVLQSVRGSITEWESLP